MEKFYNYNKDKKSFARKLRKNSTLSEFTLWNHLLKGRKLNGYQFFRQRPIDKYIVDFYCKDLKLIIELDGITHLNKQNKDDAREIELKKLGNSLIRFKDEEVIDDFNLVKLTLEKWIDNYEKKYPEVKILSKRNIKGYQNP